MTALENAVFSLNDAKVFIEYLMNLGKRHKAWPERLENFDVCILLCRSRLLRDDRRSLNLDIEGLVSNKMHRLCRRVLEGTLSFSSCYCDERTEESKHWQVRLKIERPCGLGMSRKEN
ncbi:unnamed protein product [Pocillopora meandrina]|uniref:Uncharacterized protein n=1 Tax=Pocillopora meandrina TaxID=46732 RepID=A0AAU9Y4N9_9CNID|nr:unnamed protein product [Pocillopora meandrina]